MGASESKAGGESVASRRISTGLQCPLNEEEIDSLEPTVRDKLQRYASDQEALIEGLKINHDRFRSESGEQ